MHIVHCTMYNECTMYNVHPLKIRPNLGTLRQIDNGVKLRNNIMTQEWKNAFYVSIVPFYHAQSENNQLQLPRYRPGRSNKPEYTVWYLLGNYQPPPYNPWAQPPHTPLALAYHLLLFLFSLEFEVIELKFENQKMGILCLF